MLNLQPDKNSIDLITADNIQANEKESNIETTTNLSKDFKSQSELKEFDNTYSNKDTNVVDSSADKIDDLQKSNGNLNDEEKIKTNRENGSESSGKRGLFGWFKKKNK